MQKCARGELFTNSIGMKMRLIPAGEFMRGGDMYTHVPLHRVCLTKPFYIGVYQVTQQEWEKVMGSNPSHFKGDEPAGRAGLVGDLPAVYPAVERVRAGGQVPPADGG